MVGITDILKAHKKSQEIRKRINEHISSYKRPENNELNSKNFVKLTTDDTQLQRTVDLINNILQGKDSPQAWIEEFNYFNYFIETFYLCNSYTDREYVLNNFLDELRYFASKGHIKGS